MHFLVGLILVAILLSFIFYLLYRRYLFRIPKIVYILIALVFVIILTIPLFLVITTFNIPNISYYENEKSSGTFLSIESNTLFGPFGFGHDEIMIGRFHDFRCNLEYIGTKRKGISTRRPDSCDYVGLVRYTEKMWRQMTPT